MEGADLFANISPLLIIISHLWPSIQNSIAYYLQFESPSFSDGCSIISPVMRKTNTNALKIAVHTLFMISKESRSNQSRNCLISLLPQIICDKLISIRSVEYIFPPIFLYPFLKSLEAKAECL